MKALALLAVLVGVLTAGSCATEPDTQLPPPLTVASVDSAHDVTLSDGRYRVYNTPFSLPTEVYEPGSCEDRVVGDIARRLLMGRIVTDLTYHRQWNDPHVTPGFVPGKLRFATAEQPYGDDLTDEFRQQTGPAVAAACPNVERAPLSGREVGDSGGDVYVDGGGDGESRFCSRRLWC